MSVMNITEKREIIKLVEAKELIAELEKSSADITKKSKNEINSIPTMLKIHEAATKFNLSYNFCRQLVLQNKIRYVKAGNRYLINERSLCDYLNGTFQCEYPDAISDK